jgi:hypothetical protein
MEGMREEELMPDLPMESESLTRFASSSLNSEPLQQYLDVLQDCNGVEEGFRQEKLVTGDVEQKALAQPSCGNRLQNLHPVQCCSFLVWYLLDVSCSLI